ncbi:MAG TPA: hypothetical protein VKU02_09490 [Gemmataceae bacterium]|nr:hypothetical protein [Gemmataceae bacterium]
MRFLLAVVLAVGLASVPSAAMQDREPSPLPTGSPAAIASLEALLLNPDVHRELKLTSEQIQKLHQITRSVHEKHQEDFRALRKLSGEERRRQETDLTRTVWQEIRKELENVLPPEQARRVVEIRLQGQGLQAFADPDVDRALRLTDEQKEKLELITQDTAKRIRQLFSPRAQNTFEQAMKKAEQLRRTAVAQAVALLTQEQQKTWRGLIGEPFQPTSAPSLLRQRPSGG